MAEKAVILDDKAMNRAIARISYEIIERNKGAENLLIIGILTRGVEIARRIAGKIYEVEGSRVPVGSLDITLHRDDLKTPENYRDESDIPFDITGNKVVIVDDVIYTGRSTRAAIDALMERGRPQNIQLAVLVDRGHGELPIRADFVGKNVPTSSDELIKVCVRERDGADKCTIYTRD